ncbi:hypothetical protein A2Z63_01445 [Candidatus Giovannonibacteria bacterium RIFCSPLOWO2_02_44_8]|uniref:CARDB domain-containing protein n=3 Tax=Candidatus Giovannoniibacteriota TaxID=1752738 RepID=A0A1F5XC49_9BACT|nr:MAG: hypothetical protein A2W57_01750 [Candidatus Giovannonibacteria bacterium RIFCSPHIGHO2_02_43_16]OGF85502.1 MAG: hypothetical protein A2Z63_01445 [Candidatus Giovannonibacteria bacterium RIFCSPLOWO2_02_44_8]OGF95691.1 MAG: hypothetical protein A2Y47_01880 [Candidatus Giovannonibacteria bacterium RIFCSPLOWO2_12_43_8]
MKSAAIILVSLFLIAANAEAVSLSVSPPELKASGSVLEPASAKFTVKNSSDGVALFEVYLDDFESAIKLFPESFILEAGEKKEIEVKADFGKSGKYQTDISVLAKPVANSAFRAAGGLKIPLIVEINEGKISQLGLIFASFDRNALVVAVLLLSFVILGFVFRYGFIKFKKVKN